MTIFDQQRQLNIIAPGTYIESWDVPSEGSLSRVDGELVVVAKDFINMPTCDLIDIQFMNSKWILIADASINYAATFAGVAVTPSVALKETDKGIEIHDIVSAPRGGRLTLTLNFPVVPSPFNLYIRPRLKITNLAAVQKPEGGRQEVTSIDVDKDPILRGDFHANPRDALQQLAEEQNSQQNVGGIEVIKIPVRR